MAADEPQAAWRWPLEVCLASYAAVPVLLALVVGSVVPASRLPLGALSRLHAMLLLTALASVPPLLVATSAPRRAARLVRDEPATAALLLLLSAGTLAARLGALGLQPARLDEAVAILREARRPDLLDPPPPPSRLGSLVVMRPALALLGADVRGLLAAGALLAALVPLVAFAAARLLLGRGLAPVAAAALFAAAPVHLLAEAPWDLATPAALLAVASLGLFLRRDRRPSSLALALALLFLAVGSRWEGLAALLPTFYVALVGLGGAAARHGRAVPVLVVCLLLATLPLLALLAVERPWSVRPTIGSALARASSLVRTGLPPLLSLLALAGAVGWADRRPHAMAVLGAWALAALAVAAAMGGSAGSVLVPLTLLAGCGAALLAEWSLEAHPRAPGVVVLALVVALSWDLARGVEAAWAREAADPARAEHDLLARYGRADRRCQAVVDSPEALAPYVLHFGGEPRVVRSEGELIWELGALGWDRCWYFYHGREVAGERPPRPGAEAARKLVLSHGFSEVLSSRVGGEAVFLAKREAAPPGQGI